MGSSSFYIYLVLFTGMSGDTTLEDHSELSRRVLHRLEDFVDEIGERRCTAHLDSVLDNGKYLHGRNLVQEPERFIEDHLVFPILRGLNHTLRPQPKQYAPRWAKQSGTPDFALTTMPIKTARTHDVRLFGESKSLNKYHYAQEDAKNYLRSDLDYHALILLTDGIEWELWIRPRNSPLEDSYTPYVSASLETPLKAIRGRNKQNESYSSHEVRKKIDESSIDNFTSSAVLDIVQREFDIEETG